MTGKLTNQAGLQIGLIKCLENGLMLKSIPGYLTWKYIQLEKYNSFTKQVDFSTLRRLNRIWKENHYFQSRYYYSLLRMGSF